LLILDLLDAVETVLKQMEVSRGICGIFASDYNDPHNWGY
jgi:hypothetical protein